MTFTLFNNDSQNKITTKKNKKYINTPGQEINNYNNEIVENNEIINSVNYMDRPSNPFINDILKRQSNPYNESEENLFKIDNKGNNEIFGVNENLKN